MLTYGHNVVSSFIVFIIIKLTSYQSPHQMLTKTTHKDNSVVLGVLLFVFFS